MNVDEHKCRRYLTSFILEPLNIFIKVFMVFPFFNLNVDSFNKLSFNPVNMTKAIFFLNYLFTTFF